MYCIKCGVSLAESETSCPLCGTAVLHHPDLPEQKGEKLYPPDRYFLPKIRPAGWILISTVLILLPLVITFVCDLLINDEVTWSGYAVGALVLLYTISVLPFWFKKPNPVIFVPIGFITLGLYLLYINYATNGSWFLTFACPIVGCVGLIATTIVTLLRYTRRGQLYIMGGGFIAIGAFMLLLEFLLNITFGHPIRYWSLFPLSALSLLGLLLIFLGICRPAKKALERRFFF